MTSPSSEERQSGDHPSKNALEMQDYTSGAHMQLQPDESSSSLEVPRKTKKAWHTIEHEKSVTEMPAVKLSQSSSQI